MSLQDWISRLGPADIPVFRHTRTALVQLYARRESIGARELDAVVLSDPLLTLRVIHAANNRQSRHFDTQICSTEQALMMLWVAGFLERNRELKTVEDVLFDQPRALQAVYRLLQRIHHAAWQARDFAALHVDVRAEEVEVAAQFGPIHELLLWVLAPDAALRLGRMTRKQGAEAAEMEVLGLPLAALRQPLLEAWKVPELIRDLWGEQEFERSRQIILNTTAAIAQRAQTGWWDERFQADYEALAELINYPIEVVATTVHANALHAAHSASWVPATPAAAWLPLLPGPWPAEPADEEEEAHAPAPSARPQALAAGYADSVIPLPDHAVFAEELKNIEQHLDGSFNLSQMSAHILRGLHSGLGLSRILFAMVTADGMRMKSRFTLGIHKEDPLRHFEFALGSKDLFGALMSKMQGVWINADNRARLWPMVSPHLRELIGTGDFYAMSLFDGQRPLGLIYADRGHGNFDLDAQTYTDFKMLCLQAGRGLGKLKK